MCSITFEKTKEGNKLIRAFVAVDPHITAVPQWLVNYVIKLTVMGYIYQIEKKSNNMPKSHLKIIEEKPEFYGKIKSFL
jgi:hypothetical protein